MVGIFIWDASHNHYLLFCVLSVELLFFIIIFISLLRYIYEQEQVDLNKLYAAIISYLILGIIFAVVYAIIGTLYPAAFRYTLASPASITKTFPDPTFFSEALYFSFVTLGTLGYGDWVPLLGSMKILDSLEAIAGQLFIAILIARLVGVQISQSLIKKAE